MMIASSIPCASMQRPCRNSRQTAGSSLRSPAAFVGFNTADRLSLCSRQPADFGSIIRQAIAVSGGSSGPRRQTTHMMPIGVPRVPYRTPTSGGWQWVDIWNCLYRERVIFLSKPVDEELGNQLVATMLYLDSENKKDMQIYINCSGGEVVPALAIHDTMKHIGSDVATVGFGACLGMTGFLMAVGKKGKRYMLPNTTMMMHHPSGVARGQASDIQNEAKELLRVRNYCNAVLSNATGQPVEKVQQDFNRNKYFTAPEAKEYGEQFPLVEPLRHPDD